MTVLVTGANGFIGKNLVLRFRERAGYEVITIVRGQDNEQLLAMLHRSDAIVHLAGENRPDDANMFAVGNTALTDCLCQNLRRLGKAIPVLLASSSQASLDNPYGRSKLAAEHIVEDLVRENSNPVAIYRFPGVFGKWCKPNYNSVVATFCYNKARDLPVKINERDARLRLVYIDDVVDSIIGRLNSQWVGLVRQSVEPEYSITVGELSDQIDAFKNCRSCLVSERVGTGLIRALYATYVSYLPVDKIVYDLPAYRDARGVFVEMLKTPDSGQFSFFTALPGVRRGGHYHHTKTEKFLVIKGRARFGLKHVITNEIHYIEACGEHPQIVETVPGWTHDITNIGQDEMVVMLWANEKFNPNNPDTIMATV
jgi:UDP-2-acetamido-2,6-beta-L-arabino-hexul-4-ose reductase